MKISVASNSAIVLAVLAWPLIFYGLMSQLGDYSPSTPHEIIDADHRISVGVLSAGLLCFVSALWLAGYSFTEAKARSLLAAACCIGLILFGAFGLWP